MSVPSAEWLDLMEKEYLDEFIPSGGAAVKIALASEEQLHSLNSKLTLAVLRQNCLPVRVDAAETKVHHIEQIFFAVAAQIDWDDLAERWLRDQFTKTGFEIAPEQSIRDIQGIAAALDKRPPDVCAMVERWIESDIIRDYRMSKEFRTAMALMCSSVINPQNVAPSNADVLMQWLRGEKANLTALKRLQIYQRIARPTARLHLNSLAIWLRKTGYGGMMLYLDVKHVMKDFPAGAVPIRYTRSSTLDFYEVLRQFIDDTDESKYLFMVVACTPEMLDHPKKSVDEYDALKMRTADEVRDRNRSNPLNTLVRLEAA
jgi:hypothetical protein